MFASETFYAQNKDGVKFEFTTINDDKELAVTCKQWYAYPWRPSLTFYGIVEIPEEVTHNKITRKVTSIGTQAFTKQEQLTTVIIPSTVTQIGKNAFTSSGIKYLNIPESVTSIGVEAFLDCRNLTVIDIPDNVTSLAGGVFWLCSNLTSVTIGNGVVSIGYSAFEGCGSLESVTLGKNITSIGNYAFYDCSSLTSIIIPEGVKTIGSATFSGCKNLSSVIIPESVTSIDDGAFTRCSSLTSITIPQNVAFIGKRAFNVTNIKTVVSHIEDPFVIQGINDDKGTFSESTFRSAILYVPIGTIDKYKATEGWKDFKNIVEGTGPNGEGETPVNPNPGDDNSKKRTIHVATLGTLSELISNEDKYQIGELTLTGGLNGSDIRLIRDMAGIDFGDSGDVWDDERFWDINTSGILKDLDLSNANIVAGGGAYYGRNRGSAYADDYRTKDNSISDYMFSKCKLSSITLPNNITSIGKCAFSGCSSLTSVNIPKGVTSIGDDAFQDCYNLTTIVSELEEPITVSLWLFKSISPNAKLIVPKGTKAAYQAEEGWNQITNIVEAGDDAPDGIMGVKRPYDSSGEYYDLSGRRILHPRKGLYIRNGKKEIVR